MTQLEHTLGLLAFALILVGMLAAIPPAIALHRPGLIAAGAIVGLGVMSLAAFLLIR